MTRLIRFALPAIIVAASLSAAAAQTVTEPNHAEGVWKTAFYKRGYVGNLDANSVGGPGATLRLPVPMYFAGSKIRVRLCSSFEVDVQLSKMSFVKGADRKGAIEPPPYPVQFGGAPGVEIKVKQKDIISDETAVPVTEGLWYLQESYASPKFSYAYGVEGFFSNPGDAHDLPAFKRNNRGSWGGNAYRIDVFTTDKRPIIACYGDSITHGFGSTPGSGNAYPELLSRLLKRPTLNLGVNSDLALHSGQLPGMIKSLKGVDTVIYLMGINDIIMGSFKSRGEYVRVVKEVIAGLHSNGVKFYLCTVPPAGGQREFDKKPEREALRQSVNEWIRSSAGADGVIDFDEALRDPADPVKMRVEYQSDWIHPSDAGYQKMAETAAAKIGS